MSFSCLPTSVVTATRCGWDGFIRLQEGRLRPSSPSEGRSFCLSDTSREYHRRFTAAMGDALKPDADVHALWEFITTVLQLFESGPQSRTTDCGAASMYLTWYQYHFVPCEIFEREYQNLRRMTPVDMLHNAKRVADLVMRTFMAGHSYVAAQMFLEIVQTMRGIPSGETTIMSPAMESCLGDIIRLMGVSFTNRTDVSSGKDAFLRWKAEASALTERARYQIPQSLLSTEPVGVWLQLAMSILVTMNGDVPTILLASEDFVLGAHGCAAALCAVVNPFATLTELHAMMESSILQVPPPKQAGHPQKGGEPWFVRSVLPDVLNCTEVADMIPAVASLVKHAVAARVVPESMTSAQCCDDGNAFGFCFLAAHVADLCMPSVLPLPPDAYLLFTRNALISRYVTCMQHHPSTWNIAIGYLAASPLMNPMQLSLLVDEYVAPLCAGNASSLFQWESCVVPTLLSEMSPTSLTSALRAAMRVAFPSQSEGTAGKWVAAWDVCVQRCVFAVEEAVVKELWTSGRVVQAAEFAIRHSHSGLIQSELQKRIADAGALESRHVMKIGQAVRCGALALADCSRSSGGSLPLNHSLLPSQQNRCPSTVVPDVRMLSVSVTSTPLLVLLRLSAAIADIAHTQKHANAFQSSSTLEVDESSAVLHTSPQPRRVDAFLRKNVSVSQRLASALYVLTTAIDCVHPSVAATLIGLSLSLLADDENQSVHTRTKTLLNLNVAVNRLLTRMTSHDVMMDGLHHSTDIFAVRRLQLDVLSKLSQS